MNITFSAATQSKLLLRRRNSSGGGRRYILSSTLSSLYGHSSTDSDSPSQDSESIVTKAVKLLRAPKEEWDSDQLRSLLFNGSAVSSHDLLRIITLRLGSPSKGLNFLEFFKENAQPEHYPSLSSVFQGVLELAIRRPISETRPLELYRKSKEWSIPLTEKSASLLMKSVVIGGLLDDSLLMFNELDPSLKSTQICNSLLRLLLESGRTKDAFHVLEEMLKPNGKFPPNGFTCEIVFAEFVKRDRPGRSFGDEEIVRVVTNLGEHRVFPDTFKLTQLITKLCWKRKNDIAWEILHNVMKLGGAVDAPSCNALLSGLGRERDVQRMNKLLTEMEEMKIQPNVITFGILINHLCKTRRIDAALQVFDKLRGNGESNFGGVEPDVVLFNTLIDGLCKVGRQEEGLSLLEQMKTQHKQRPNTVTYNCLIDGFCKTGNIDKARELFNQMNKEVVLPNVVTLNTLVDGMCKHGKVYGAVEFFDEMKRKGIKGNAVTYTVLIAAFCNVNNIDKAMQYFDEMLSSDCFPDPVVYYSLINGLSLAGRMDDASVVVSKLKQAGFGLDLGCYNVLISGFCRKKKLERVYELLNEMEETGVKPDTVTYNTLVSYLAKTGDFGTASKVMRKMIAEGLAPSVVTYGALIHAYCLNGNLDEAMKIFGELCSTSDVPPNNVIYNILIDAMCKNNDVDSAVSLMDDMKVRGVKPNTTTYNAILKGVRDKKMLNKAFELMDRMIEDACNPDYITMEILTEWLSAIGEIEKLKNFVQGYQVSSCTA